MHTLLKNLGFQKVYQHYKSLEKKHLLSCPMIVKCKATNWLHRILTAVHSNSGFCLLDANLPMVLISFFFPRPHLCGMVRIMHSFLSSLQLFYTGTAVVFHEHFYADFSLTCFSFTDRTPDVINCYPERNKQHL